MPWIWVSLSVCVHELEHIVTYAPFSYTVRAVRKSPFFVVRKFENENTKIFSPTFDKIKMVRAMGKKSHYTYANSKGSGESAHPRSLARTYAVRSRI